MRSSKTLFIILVVGFIIFVVSFAIGRPWWQALLFSIGFLLVAAIVTSRGLLIPEGLLEMRLARRFQVGRPTEATDKTDKEVFLERMDLALTEFSAQS